MTNQKAIGVLGNGSWGTALSKMLTDNGHTVNWWIRNKEAVQFLKDRLHNPHYLQSVKFPEHSILPSDNLQDVFSNCDLIVFCVPAAYAQPVLEQFTPEMLQGKTIISAVKGMLPASNSLLNDYLEATFGFDVNNYISVMGPCHAEEVAAERLSYLTFSCMDEQKAAKAAKLFETPYIRTCYNHDIWGAQLAAVMKNIYALGAGIAHGLDYGDNFLSVYITNCYREMYGFLQTHFDQVHPAEDRPDFHTSAYLGDLLVTAYSLHSRNRTFGMMIGKGYSVAAASLEMNMVAEGYNAAKCIRATAESIAYEMPIAKKIYEILWEQQRAATAFAAIEEMLH